MPNELLSSLATALESLNAERLTEHYWADAFFEDPAAGQMVRGHEELRAYFSQLFSLPEVGFEVVYVFEAGDWAAAEWIWRGVSRRSQQPFEIRGASIFQLSEGLIARETIYYDPAAWAA